MDKLDKDFSEVLKYIRNSIVHEPLPEDIKYKLDPAEKQKARKKLRWILLIIVGFQLFFMDGVLIATGFGWIELGQTILSVFVTGIFGQVAGFVYIMLKYYFND